MIYFSKLANNKIKIIDFGNVNILICYHSVITIKSNSTIALAVRDSNFSAFHKILTILWFVISNSNVSNAGYMYVASHGHVGMTPLISHTN